MAKEEVGTAYVEVLPKVDGAGFLRSAARALLDTADKVEALGDREPVSDGAAAVRAEATSESEALAAEVERLREQRDVARDLAVAFQQEADHNAELLAKRADEAKDAIRGVLLHLDEVLKQSGSVDHDVIVGVAMRHGVTL
jgi:hypothetical protein